MEFRPLTTPLSRCKISKFRAKAVRTSWISHRYCCHSTDPDAGKRIKYRLFETGWGKKFFYFPGQGNFWNVPTDFI